MAVTVAEASAINVLVRYATGHTDSYDPELPVDEHVHKALATLLGAAHKRLMAGLAERDVDDLFVKLTARCAPRPTARPEPMWDDDDVDDVAVRAPGHLHPIDGIIPVELVTKVRGASQHIGREVRLEETIWFAGEAEVDDVSLKRTKQGPKRHQVLLITSLFELDERLGRRILNNLKEQYRLGGPDTLPFKQVHDAELVARLGLAGSDSIVVIFDDETRAVWPDDWETPPARPRPGDRILRPGSVSTSEPGLVAELLDLDGNELETIADDEAADDGGSDVWDEEG